MADGLPGFVVPSQLFTAAQVEGSVSTRFPQLLPIPTLFSRSGTRANADGAIITPIQSESRLLLISKTDVENKGCGERGRNRIRNKTYFQQHAEPRMTPKAMKADLSHVNRARIERAGARRTARLAAVC
jgi:hypothetical protein